MYLLSQGKAGEIGLTFLAFAIWLSSCAERPERNVIAEIEDRKIYFEEVDKLVQNSIYEHLFAINDVRDIALNLLIDDQLVNLEAKRRHLAADSLLSIELTKLEQKFPVAHYIRENALESGVVDPEFPFKLISIQGRQGKVILLKTYRHYLRRKYLSELRYKYQVKVHLSSPKSPALNLDGIDRHTKGNLTAAVSLSIIYNYSCNVCKEKEPIFRRLYEKYKDKIRFNYFLLSPKVDQSILFSNCAGKQGKYWDAHQAITSNKLLDSSGIESLAGKIGLNYSACLDCMIDPKTRKEIEISMDKLRALSIQVTPTIIINNRIYYGEISETAISRAIEDSI